MPDFRVKAPRLRRARRLRLAPHFRHDERAAHELGQSLERGGLVLLLAAELLRFDDDDAVGGDAVIAQREQPLAGGRRQRARARGVEAQLHGARDLVDVLAAGALRADRREVELRLGDRHAAVHSEPAVEGQAATPSVRGLDAQNRAGVLVGQEVQQLVRALPHVADALTQIHEQHLTAQLFPVVVEANALEMSRARDLAHAHAADERVALPIRELVARVDREARGCDRRHPVDDRILESFARKPFRLPRAGIRAARADERPAVVHAGLQYVDLVAAVRALLALPELARRRMHDETLRAAMPERIDLGLVALAAGKGIVSRHAAVVVQAQDLAGVAHWILRTAAVAGIAERAHVELAVAAEGETRHAARVRRDEDVAHVRQRSAVPHAARYAEPVLPFCYALVVAQVHEPIRRELRMQRDVEETRQSLRPHLGHAGDGLRIERAVAHEPQLPAALRDEHLAARQPGETPRALEPARMHDDANFLLGRLVREGARA